MKSSKNIFIALFALMQTGFSMVYGQSPVGIGQWRVHYPYDSDAQSLALVDDKVYCSNGIALFYYSKTDQSLNGISKKDGLTGVNITKLGSYKSKELIIGYDDGNIDFLTGNSVSQFNDIQRSSITGSKSINNFRAYGNNLFVSADYGLSIINMDRLEVSDSYLNVSSDGSANIFYASVLSQDGDSIFVASQKGLLGAPYSPGVNLRDYNSWKRYDSIHDGLPTGDTKTVGRLGDVIFAGVNGKGVYYFDGTQWNATSMTGTEVRSISDGDQSMTVTVDVNLYKVNAISSIEHYSTSYYYQPYDALLDDGGLLWFVQPNYGIGYYAPPHPTVIGIGAPVGPFTQDTYKLRYLDSKVVNCRGGVNVAYGSIYRESAVMYLNSDDVWTANTIYTGLPFQSRDLLDAALHPASGKWYFSTFGFGLIKFDPKSQTSILYDTSASSPLKTLYTTGLITDNTGTVWVCGHSQIDRTANKPFLYAIDPLGNWSSFKAVQDKGKYPLEIVVDQQSNKWLRLDASGGIRGLMMFKEINKTLGTSTQIYFNVDDASGALPDINVNTIDVDKTGQVWIGTNQGICVFTNPSQIKSYSIPKVYLPIVDGFPLFFDKQINCIKTDGANRKWVGTPDGVFLLSSDGLQTIFHFNESNSPMINNNVNTITVNEQTGEVFFGTDKGIISYRGDATTTEAGQEYSNVKIFPNPVPHDFDGWVGISGLANNSRVKITDIAGKLTYETPANGGTASWNLKDYTGRRATAGVYLIFNATDDGSEKYVGKIAVQD